MQSGNGDRPEDLPENIVGPWKEAGAELFWLRVDNNGDRRFVSETKGLRGDLPTFGFRRWPEHGLGNLPVPKFPFALRLSGTTDAHFKQLARLKTLRDLDVNFNQVTGATLNELMGLKHLQSLHLRGTKITNVGLKNLVGLKKLTQLDVYGTRVTDAGLKRLASMLNLRSLDLGETRVTDAGLKELAKLKNLQSLSLEMTKITGAGLKRMVGLKRLRSLNLFSTKITDGGLRELASFKGLRSLSVRCTKVTDAGITELTALPNLQSLDLQATEVTNVGLKELVSLKALQSLRLSGTGISDSMLSELLKLPQLQSLDLNGKKLDQAVLNRRSRKREIDWAVSEELLVKEASRRFPQIAEKYPNDEFYGVFFDCDVVNTGVQAHMNTNVLLRQSALECQHPERPPARPLYPGLSIEQVMEELRWDGGGWNHFGVFAGPDFTEIAEAYDRLQDENALKEDFMLMACRAVVRMERSGVFECLRRTQEFRVLCVYVNETVEDADRRLKRVRRALRK